jgi:threonine efflux protein
MISELWAFALIMLIGQFSPGPDMLLLTRTSLAEGLRSGWMMVLGISTGLTLHATLAIGGIAVVLAKGGAIASVLEGLAALYLLWLAFGLIKKPVATGEVDIPKRNPYLRGLFCNLLNPKALVFFASVVATFLAQPYPDWWPFALWLIVVIEALVFWCLWVWLLQIPKIRHGYERFSRSIDLLFALALTGLAIHLLFS